MTQQDIIKTHKIISMLLNNKQLKDSFNALDLFLHSLQNWSFSEKKIELENNYKLMLQYAVDGVQDPERHLIYNKLITSIYTLSDEVKEALLFRDSVSYEYSQMRYYAAAHPPRLQLVFSELADVQVNMSLSEAVDNEDSAAKYKEFRKRYETIQAALFNKIWLTAYFTDDELNLLKEAMTNEKVTEIDKCLLVSALTLNIMRNFDEKKILLLFDFYGQENEQIKQRSLVGIMLSMYLYNSRLHFYPSLRNRLVLLADDDDFRKNIQFIIIQFIRSKETESITRKMREEIFPEIMKISPHLKQKVDFEDVNNIDDFEEKNPEWNEMIEKSGVADKLKEISELQVEGADVLMSTFASLKHFPFFSVISNWFLPFDTENTTVQNVVQAKEKTFLGLLLKSWYMCNSDKYSFCLSLSHVSENQRKIMTSTFRLESEQMEEIAQDENLLSGTAKKEKISNQYLQDLYRFYKLYNYRIHFTDIFSLPLDFQNTWFYKIIGFEDNNLREIAEYHFSKGYYKEALDIYLHLIENERDNAELYQKAGYCRQFLGDIEQALENYLFADTIINDNKWTIKRIALCYRALKRYEKALEYYRRASSLEPKNIALQLNIGHCFLEMKNYKDALNIYFKIEVISPENEIKAWRAIAWCSFLSGKFEQAQRYCTKLLGKRPSHSDLLNAAHVEWSLGNRHEALEFYKQSIKMNNDNLPEFLAGFEKDIPALLNAGIKEDEIPIMTDRLKYMI